MKEPINKITLKDGTVRYRLAVGNPSAPVRH